MSGSVTGPYPTPAELGYPEPWPNGVAIVPTRRLRLAIEAVQLTVAECGVAAFKGPPSTGKTTAALVAANLTGLPTKRMEAPSKKSEKNLEQKILETFAGGVDKSMTGAEMQDEIAELMKVPMVMVIDEGDRLRKDGGDMLRYVRAHLDVRASVILVGHELGTYLKGHREIEERLSALIDFAPLTRAELLDTVRAMNPVFAAADDSLLLDVDRRFTRGSLRMWGKLCARALHYAPKLGVDHLTPELYAMARATWNSEP